MNESFENLTAEEKDMLYKAPAIVSLMAASTDGKIDEGEERDAIELSHLRTYSSEEELQPYYEEVEKRFKRDWLELIETYSPIDKQTPKRLQKDYSRIEEILGKMDKRFSNQLKQSLKSYAEHVGKLHPNYMKYFILPFWLPGVNM